MALRDHNVINTHMSNRMLKFKTEVPKCQGVKLLKYKLCFNIPKHYTKYASMHKKNDAHKSLIFQSNVTNCSRGENSLKLCFVKEIFENPGLMPPCHLHTLPHSVEDKDICWENKTADNYHLMSPFLYFLFYMLAAVGESSDLKWHMQKIYLERWNLPLNTAAVLSGAFCQSLLIRQCIDTFR